MVYYCRLGLSEQTSVTFQSEIINFQMSFANWRSFRSGHNVVRVKVFHKRINKSNMIWDLNIPGHTVAMLRKCYTMQGESDTLHLPKLLNKFTQYVCALQKTSVEFLVKTVKMTKKKQGRSWLGISFFRVKFCRLTFLYGTLKYVCHQT